MGCVFHEDVGDVDGLFCSESLFFLGLLQHSDDIGVTEPLKLALLIVSPAWFEVLVWENLHDILS